MSNYFNHIPKSTIVEPLLFFKLIIDENNILKAIKSFFPEKLITTDEGGNKIEFFDDNREYQNIDESNLTYEVLEIDRDYRQTSAQDPPFVSFWIKKSFQVELREELNMQASISYDLLVKIIERSSGNYNSIIIYFNNTIADIKKKIISRINDRLYNEIDSTLDSLIKDYSEIAPIESIYDELENDKRMPVQFKTEPNSLPVKNVNPSSVLIFNKIYNKLVTIHLTGVNEKDFVEFFMIIYQGKIPSKEIDIEIKNIKTIYYILHKIKLHNKAINLQKLEIARKLLIKGNYFEYAYMDSYPYTCHKKIIAIIDECFSNI